MGYKLIVMDMDGTLTNSKKEISEETRTALIEAQKLGASIVLASGRPTPGLYREAKILEMDRFKGYLLSYNGAHVCDYPNQQVIYNKTIDKKYILPIINNAKALNLGIMVNKGEYVVVDDSHTYQLEYEAHATNMKTMVVDDLRTFVDFEPNKFLISAPPEYLKMQFADFNLPFGDRLSIYTSAPFYIEVVSNGIDKGKALAGIAERLGIQREEIIAFGDEMNDLTMLQYAGHGVAMGNAVKPIKLIANEITASNDEDGIAKSLYKAFPEIKHR